MLKLLLFGLFYLTQGCPPLGGDAVFEARAMLGGMEVNDAELCNGYENLDRATQISTVSNIHPNPARDFIRLPDQTGKQYLVTDMFGRVIAQGVLDSEFLHTADFASGTYLITLEDNLSRPMTMKFVILRD